jgi:hypothetical protein
MATESAGRSEAIHREELLANLHRLVEAIDRRVPHLERRGEVAIATDAAVLRAQAVALINTLVDAATQEPLAADTRQRATEKR